MYCCEGHTTREPYCRAFLAAREINKDRTTPDNLEVRTKLNSLRPGDFALRRCTSPAPRPPPINSGPRTNIHYTPPRPGTSFAEALRAHRQVSPRQDRRPVPQGPHDTVDAMGEGTTVEAGSSSGQNDTQTGSLPSQDFPPAGQGTSNQQRKSTPRRHRNRGS